MGQKTHPHGFRLGIVKDWKSRWYAERDFPRLLKEDETIRKYLHRRLHHAALSKVEIERKPSKIVVTLHTARPGVVIGKRGAEVDKLRDELAVLTKAEVSVNVEEIKRRQSSGSVSRPSSISEQIDPAVERVIARCLEPQPEGRPQSVYQVLAALPFAVLVVDSGTHIRFVNNAAEQFLELSVAALEGDPAWLEWAVKHRDVIARFGRFPHRNAVLGRASTPDEEAFLQQPESSFQQREP